MSTHTDLALTITTDQIKNWGIVGIVIIVVAAGIVMKLVQTMVSRLVLTLVMLGALFVCWQQHASIEQSIKECDPHVLFIHLEISDPAQKAKCMEIVHGATTAPKDGNTTKHSKRSGKK